MPSTPPGSNEIKIGRRRKNHKNKLNYSYVVFFLFGVKYNPKLKSNSRYIFTSKMQKHEKAKLAKNSGACMLFGELIEDIV